MDKITELKQERAKLVKKQRNLIDGAEEEDRGLNSEEREQFDRIDGDIDELEERISDLKKVQDRQKKKVIDGLDDDQRGKQDGDSEYREVFEKFARRGINELTREEASMLRELRAQNIANASKGGYLVPETWENRIIEKLNDANVMRRLATIETTSTETNIPVSTSKPQFGWIDEEGSYPETDEEFGNKSVDAWKSGGIIKVSEELLYDNTYNLQGRIERDFVTAARDIEEAGFIVGDGVKKPRGLLLDAEVGKTAAAVDAITFNELIDLVYSLRRPYRRNANFMLNDNSTKALRKIKNNNDQYVWEPSAQAGEPDRLLSYPLEYAQDMPDMAADNKPVAFGDFSYYSIYDRKGIALQRLNEKYADTGQIGFKGYKRVDGLLTLSEAVQVLQMASS